MDAIEKADAPIAALCIGQRGHIPALDGLRGIAILLVFAYHYGAGGVRSPSTLVRLLGSICEFGWSGVDLFFVLSGFLITGILYDTRPDPAYYKNFYARRALRIFPLYYLFAVILFLVGDYWSPGHISFLFYVGYPAAFIWPTLIDVPVRITHLWSLSLEEQFYGAWPWLIANVRRPLKLCLVAIISAPLLRCLVMAAGWNPDWAYGFLLCRMDSLAVGAAIALLARAGWEARLNQWAPVAIIAGCGGLIAIFALRHTAGHQDTAMSTAGFSLTALTYGGLLVLSFTTLRRLFSLSILQMFGRYSYGLYLFHFPLTSVMEPMKPHLSVLYAPFCLLVNLAVASASFHLFEQPIMGFKNRFRYLRP